MQNTIHQDLELIERYFESTLSLAELDLVSERLENDPEFRERLERYEEIHINVNNLLSDASEKEEMKADWQAMLRAEHAKDEAKVRRGNFGKYLLAVAASVALLVVAFWGYDKFVSQAELETSGQMALATQYWEQTDRIKLHGERSGGQEDAFLVLLNEAKVLYQKREFQKAYTLLEKVPEKYEKYYAALMLQGKGLFREGKTRAAIGKFDAVLARSGKGGREQALWFRALAFLKLGEVELAKKDLNMIVTEQYPLAGKAGEILERI